MVWTPWGHPSLYQQLFPHKLGLGWLAQEARWPLNGFLFLTDLHASTYPRGAPLGLTLPRGDMGSLKTSVHPGVFSLGVKLSSWYSELLFQRK